MAVLCQGPYGGPRVGGLFLSYERGTYVLKRPSSGASKALWRKSHTHAEELSTLALNTDAFILHEAGSPFGWLATRCVLGACMLVFATAVAGEERRFGGQSNREIASRESVPP